MLLSTDQSINYSVSDPAVSSSSSSESNVRPLLQ